MNMSDENGGAVIDQVAHCSVCDMTCEPDTCAMPACPHKLDQNTIKKQDTPA